MNCYMEDTNLNASATKEDIKLLCEEAKEQHFTSVCVNPCYVELARELLQDSSVNVATVIDFPLGSTIPMVKSYEAITVLEGGATEIGLVVHMGAIKDHDYEYTKNEIEEIRDSIDGNLLKVIVDISILTEEEIMEVTKICNETFVHFIQISAKKNLEAIDIIKKYKNEVLEIMVSEVETFEEVGNLIDMGVTRIGTSHGAKIMKGEFV